MVLIKNENYILRGHCWLDAILITTYIQQYVDMTMWWHPFATTSGISLCECLLASFCRHKHRFY